MIIPCKRSIQRTILNRVGREDEWKQSVLHCMYDMRNKQGRTANLPNPEIIIPTSYYWPTWRSLLVEESVSSIEVDADDEEEEDDAHNAHGERKFLHFLVEGLALLLEGLDFLVDSVRVDGGHG